MKLDDRIPWQSLLLIFLIVTAVSMWTAVLPLVEDDSSIYKPLYAAFYVLESAIGNVDYSLFSESLASGSFWRIYTIFLHLLMPITTYGVVLVLFMKAFGWFRYTLFRGNKKIIMFSEMTDKSRAYAGRIDTKDSLLIFCNTEDGEKQHFSEESAKNMIFTEQSELQLLKQLSKKDLTIMEMGEDEEANLHRSVEIIRYLEEESQIPEEDKRTINLYTVSGHPEAAAIMDNVMGRGAEDQKPLAYHQTVINEDKRIAFNLLHEKPLYRLVDEETKQLDIMIIGFGRMGQEVLKALSWTGCFPWTDTNVHVISPKAVEHGKELLSECPELGVDLRHNGGYLKPEGGEQLNPDAPIYYYSTEIKGPKFDKIIRSLAHSCYIVVSLGNDAATLETALRVYRMIMRERYLKNLQIKDPEIHVRIHSDENLKFFSSKEDRSIFSHFKHFGSDKDIYGVGQVGESELDKMAERARDIYRSDHHLEIEESKYAYLPEFEKNANQAAALHALYKLHFMKNIEKVKCAENALEESMSVFNRLVSAEEREEIANWEHIRWQAYMRTEGFIGAPYEKTEELYHSLGDSADDTNKKLREVRIHPAIGDNERHLKRISKLLKDPYDPDYYHKNDLKFVDSIPNIIQDYYKIVPAGDHHQA